MNPPASRGVKKARGGSIALDRQLTYRMHMLHKLSDQESQRRYPLETGLSMSEGRCLSAIGTFEPVSINLLAQKANLNKAQASRAAQALVNHGFVKKIPSTADGRGVELTLTTTGRKAWKRVMELIDGRNQEIFGCLTALERRQLGDLLDRLIEYARRPDSSERKIS